MPKKQRISRGLRDKVRERARGYCEYRLVHERFSMKSYQADHVVTEKHGGKATVENLAWPCAICNYNKGSDLTSIDPSTGRLAILYNPRTQQWRHHFRLHGALIEPLTASARVTVSLLQLNSQVRVDEREELIRFGFYPQS